MKDADTTGLASRLGADDLVFLHAGIALKLTNELPVEFIFHLF